MTPTREQVRRQLEISDAAELSIAKLDAVTDAVMALLEPKPAPRRWIVEEGASKDGWATIPGAGIVHVVRELQVPTMDTLHDTYMSALCQKGGCTDAGIRAVIAACGLEVEK